ncbi:hypothetical protein N9Z67_02165 [Rhodopirellula sp.]|nr:hypothetical protein [Rhodopirellula sp.]
MLIPVGNSIQVLILHIRAKAFRMRFQVILITQRVLLVTPWPKATL